MKFLKNVGVFNSGNGASRRDDREAFNCKGGGWGKWKVNISGKASASLQLSHRVPDGAFHRRSLETSHCRPFNYLRKARQSS